jgi:Plasmid stabilisation system protein.
MRLHYSQRFRADLTRLHEFLAQKDPIAASRVAWRLRQAPKALLSQPRQGQRLKTYSPREVRRLLVGPYELRYEIQGADIFLLNLWHSRERRP